MSEAYEFEHVSVLYEESLEALAIKPDGLYVDCTLGGAGHSSGILKQLSHPGRLISLDKDEDARKAATSRLSAVGSSAEWQIVASDFSALPDVLSSLDISHVDGILADLGVSSWQLDQVDRGFSYGQDGPLDMRMDRSRGKTAADLVNLESEDTLAGIIRQYGEERFSKRIAAALVARRQQQPITSTVELADIVKKAMPGSALKEKQHPARRTFQALRIAVNGELTALEQLLAGAPNLLNDHGRLCIITFHSLEDRMVKEAFRTWENPCICPRTFPVCTCNRKPLGHQIGRRGMVAAADETKENPRARSARLRCFERIWGEVENHAV